MTTTIDYTTLTEQPNVIELVEKLLTLPVTEVYVDMSGTYEENMEFEDGVVTFGYPQGPSEECYKVTNVSGYNIMFETLCQDKLKDEALEELMSDWHGWLLWDIGDKLQNLTSRNETIDQLIKKCQPK